MVKALEKRPDLTPAFTILYSDKCDTSQIMQETPTFRIDFPSSRMGI